MLGKVFVVTQVKSSIGRHKTHQLCLKGLKIVRMHRPVKIEGTPQNLGMLTKIAYMLKIEEE